MGGDRKEEMGVTWEDMNPEQYGSYGIFTVDERPIICEEPPQSLVLENDSIMTL